MSTKTKPAKSLQYQMRAVHRVVGYLTIGLFIVYAVSGIILIHRTGDFMKKSIPMEEVLEPDLTGEELGEELNIKYYKVVEETDQTVVFNFGTYDKATGQASYVKKEVVWPFGNFIKLHKLADKQNPAVCVFTMAFGIAMLVLVVTSLLMYKPKNQQFKTNMLLTAIGIALAIVLLTVA